MENPAPSLSETVLDLKRAGDGDEEAAERLWARYYDKVVPAVRVRLGAKLRAKVETMDIVQQVFLEAVQTSKEREFKSEGHFRAWLSRIVENRIRKTARDWGRQKRAQAKDRPLLNTRQEVRSGTDKHRRPVSIVEEFDQLELMETAMEGMDEPVRELIVMRLFEELTYGEIGEATGRNEDAARKAVSRAVEALARRMDP